MSHWSGDPSQPLLELQLKWVGSGYVMTDETKSVVNTMHRCLVLAICSRSVLGCRLRIASNLLGITVFMAGQAVEYHLAVRFVWGMIENSPKPLTLLCHK